MNLGTLGLTLYREVIDEGSDTHAYVCVKKGADVEIVEGDDSQVIVVLFRGTVTTQNVKTDLDTTQVSMPDAERWRSSPVSGDPRVKVSADVFEEAHEHFRSIRVHKGFLESYEKIRSRVLSAVMDCALNCFESNAPASTPAPKVYVTGHSLGGALAQLFSTDLACNVEVLVDPASAANHNAVVGVSKRRARRNSFGGADSGAGGEGGGGGGGDLNAYYPCQFPIACYTFGQPRVGNAAWSKFFARRVPHCFRVVTEGDVFVTVPKASFSLAKGKLAVYQHTGVEVVLDDAATGTICVAPTAVESTFRFSKGYYSIANHSLVKYRDCLEASFKSAELRQYYEKQSEEVGGGGGDGSGGREGTGEGAKDGFGSGAGGRGGRRGSKMDLPEWVVQR
jgi:uncharacterized membrane protein YgcG